MEKKSKKYFSSNESEDMTPIDYLYQNKTSELIKDALNEVILYRPDDPIQFLVDFFAPVNDNVVEEAYRILTRCHHTDAVFQRNILEVFNMLQLVRNKNSNLKGLLGETFNSLLDKILNNTPAEYKGTWYEKLTVHKTCVVSFRHFYNSVLLCFVMEEFIKVCSSIYNDLDIDNIGKANRELCLIVLASLHFVDTEESPFDKFFEKVSGKYETFQNCNSESFEETDFIKKAIDIFFVSVA